MRSKDFPRGVMPSLVSNNGMTRLAFGAFDEANQPIGIEVWEFPVGNPQLAQAVYKARGTWRGDPSLSPDGRLVGFFHDAGRGRVVNVNTRQVVLDLPPLRGNMPIRMRNDSVVYQRYDIFNHYDPTTDGIWEQPLEGGPPVRLGEYSATGFAYLTPTGYVTTEQNFVSHLPQMAPAFAGDASAGVSQDNGGFLFQLPGEALRDLFHGEIWNDPALCQESPDSYAIAGWAPLTVLRVWSFTVDEIKNFPVYTPMPTVVRVNRALWFGFFVGRPDAGGGWSTSESPLSTPGNCYLQIPESILFDHAGVPIAQYVAAEADGQSISDEVAKARQRRPDLPVISYWTAADHGKTVPPGDWIGVEAYRSLTESIPAFERRIWTAVARCPKVALIPQCYSNNIKNTVDLVSIVPVIARIVAEAKNVVAVLPFSGTGRATGLQDHPEVRWAWEEFGRGIPSAPVIQTTPPAKPPPSTPPPLPTSPPPFFPKARIGAFMKVYLKLNNKYIGVDPTPIPRKTGDSAFPVYQDRNSGGAWEEVELTKRDNGQFDARFIAANRQLSLSSNGLESRGAGTFGTWELIYATEQPDGIKLAYRADGATILGPVLTLEEV
jgi:hypothetical protein